MSFPSPTYTSVTLLGNATSALQAVPLQQLEAAGGFNVQTFGAIGDGVHDDTADIQEAINAGAGISAVVFPGTSAFYLISSPLILPSDSYLIINPGATIKTGNNADCSGIEIVANASNIQIDLFGTLDGNVVNQPVGGNPNGGITGQGNVPCSNVYIRGGRTGVITNWKNWPINLASATNCEVNGLTLSNSGNSVEFAGITPRTSVSSGTYTNGTGVTTLATATAHGIRPGQTFCFFGTTSNIPFSELMGEYVATAGTSGTTVNFTGPAGLGAVTILPVSSTAFVGITAVCSNVGFVDCVVQDIQDLGLVLYGGVVGGYVRNCEVTGCSGPYIFNDLGQPGSNWDCEISGCYSHDNTGSGPNVSSNSPGRVNHRVRVFNNIVTNNLAGGIFISSVDGADVFGNELSGNRPRLTSSPPLAGICGNLLIGANTNARAWGNTISDPGPAYVSRTAGHITGGTYSSFTGVVTLTTAAAHNIPVGGQFYVGPLRGTGAVSSLKGIWTADAGTAGTAINFTGPTGLGTVTIFDGATTYEAPFPDNNTVSSGTYDSLTGAVVLTTTTAHGYVPGNMFLLSNVIGTDEVAMLNGLQVATAGTAGSTLNFTAAAGGTMTLTGGGGVLPPNVGIAIFPNSPVANDPSNNLIITNNTIIDSQTPAILGAALGGTWGVNGYSVNNVYGARQSVLADVSTYVPGIGGSVQGPSQDTRFQVSVGNYILQGYLTFQGLGAPALNAQVLQPKGLTPAWNFNGGIGEVDFFCGRDSGSPGGFDFIQVAPITVSAGTYDSGTGAVAMTTRVPHGMLPGNIFTVSGSAGTGADIALLNGVHTADAGTTGSTLNFTDTTGLTIASITGATIVPAGTAGGVIDTTRGVSGSLLTNDGFGNTRLGGSLVFAPQVAALANAGTVTVNPHIGFVLIQNGSSIATGAVVLPAPRAGQLADGAELELNFQNPVGALSVTAAVGAGIVNAPTAVAAAGNSVNFINVGTVWTRRIAM